jgi:signal transduction histidine kinase
MGHSDNVNILLVDDRHENLVAMQAVLETLSENLVTLRSGKALLEYLLRGENVAVIVLDVQMPDMDGFETAEVIRQSEKWRHVPIIFLTAYSKNRVDVLRGYAVGAVDYLTKPLVPEIFKAKVQGFIDLFRARRALERQLDATARINRELAAKTEELEQSEDMLHRLNETLEQRVADRTAELEAKNEALATMSQQLWQTSKLATIGELAASIAHELNNPLATVSLRTESLLLKIPSDNPNRRALEVIEQEVQRMANLVANLLQFSRRYYQHVSTIDVREELEKTVELIRGHLRNHSVNVVREFTSDLPMVRMDRQQLRQVFLNLLTNACDAMPDGGTLTLRTGVPQMAPGNICIEIADTGIGILPENLPKVLDPFFTTKPEGKGTGLGLPICRRIVQDHHGTLEIASEVGKGTTISIFIAIANAINTARPKDEGGL